MSCRYFRYETWEEANANLKKQGRPPYSQKTSEIKIIEITKKEAILMELKNRLEKELTPFM